MQMSSLNSSRPYHATVGPIENVCLVLDGMGKINEKALSIYTYYAQNWGCFAFSQQCFLKNELWSQTTENKTKKLIRVSENVPILLAQPAGCSWGWWWWIYGFRSDRSDVRAVVLRRIAINISMNIQKKGCRRKLLCTHKNEKRDWSRSSADSCRKLQTRRVHRSVHSSPNLTMNLG